MKLACKNRRSVKAAGLGSWACYPVCGLLFLVVFLLVSSGCTRRWYRTGADCEVTAVLEEKNCYPEWELNDYYVYPHPTARFADATNPDCPPMPPDDPAAWFLSPHPQKPRDVAYVDGTGYLEMLAGWDAENRARLQEAKKTEPTRESTDKPETLHEPKEPAKPDLKQLPAVPFVEQHGETPPRCQNDVGQPLWAGRKEPFLITLDQAIELAVLNSREFQTAREDLYLVALPVTLERFAFAPQFEAINQMIRERAGRDFPGGSQNRFLFPQSGNRVGMTKLFSTGALLMVQFANETIINLTGNKKHTLSQSTLTLDIVQPLLRGGGRAVTLEPLTQAERDLLYEVRDFARFHKDFFVRIAAGAGQLSGGGGGDFGGLQLTVRGQAANVGFYPTLLQLAQLENERQNVESLDRLRKFFVAFAEGGGVSQLQVDQVEQDYLRARDTVLQRETRYADSVDQFKLQLGLPTDLPLTLDTTLLQPLREQVKRYESAEANYAVLVDELEKMAEREPAAKELRATIRRMLSASELVKDTRFQADILLRWQTWQALSAGYDQPAQMALDYSQFPLAAPFGPAALLPGLQGVPMQSPAIRRLAELHQQRQDLQDQRTQYESKEQEAPEELVERIRKLSQEIDLGTMELSLRVYELEPWKREGSPARQERVHFDLFRRVANPLALLLAEARAERLAVLEKMWPQLPAICVQGRDLLKLDEEEAQNTAGRTALDNRLDLMNARAQLVDAWRQIAVFANSLLGTFDVRYNMTSLTPPEQAKPLDFAGKKTRHQLILNTELPLVRKLERNNYRASLIGYQRQRRALMAAEDQTLFQIRQNLRQLRQLKETYKIQQRSLELAYSQVDNALEQFRAPPAPNEPRDAATAAAALTDQLLRAQRSVPQAQNQLISAWVNYVTTRMELYRDLELMQVDTRGVWIDEYSSADCTPPARCDEAQGVPADIEPSSGPGSDGPDLERLTPDAD